MRISDWSSDVCSSDLLRRVRVPLGVIGIIYESRPNVTADAAALGLMSGNAVILRGGSEAVRSNRAIHAALAAGLSEAGLPRSEERRVGKECGSPCRSRWSPYI